VNPDHLFLGTQLDNNHDMIAKGRARYLSGEEHPMAKLQDKDVMRLKKMVAAGHRLVKVAALLGICKTHASDIKRGKNWKHLSP